MEGQAMKMQTVVIAVTGRSGLLAHTHPGMTLGQEFAHREWIEQTNHQADPPIKAIGSLFGGLPSSMRVQQTVRRDYVFFGTCDTPVGREHQKTVKVPNEFFVMQEPDRWTADGSHVLI
jgi:hypothetical protein